MCWVISGGDAIRYQRLRRTDILLVFDAFLSWANQNGFRVITAAEKSRLLAAARALMQSPLNSQL